MNISKYIAIFLFLSVAHSYAQRRSFPLNQDRLMNARRTEVEAISKKDSALLAEAYYLYSKLHWIAGDYNSSKDYLLKSLRILEPRGDSYELGRLYLRFAESPLESDSQKKHYAALALDLFKRIKSLKGEANAYLFIGEIYYLNSLKNHSSSVFNKAFECFRKVEKIGIQIHDTLVVADAYRRMSDIFSDRDLPTAIFYLEKSLALFKMQNSTGSMISTTLNLGTLYVNSGNTQKGYQTISNAEEMMRKRDRMSDYPMLLLLDLAYINYYQKTGRWKSAFQQYQLMHGKEARQFQKERDAELLRLQMEYETSKKESQLGIQKKELAMNAELMSAQTTLIVVTLTLFGISSVLGFFFFKLNSKNKRLSNKYENLVREQNHRAKNNLQMISSLLHLQGRLLADSEARVAIEESRLRIQSMTVIQRKLYDDNQLTHINLATFIPELTEMILYAYGIAEEVATYRLKTVYLDAERVISVGLIVTELITNACKYALKNHLNPVLEVSCTENDTHIFVSVSDNGVVASIPALSQLLSQSKQSSFGIKLIRLQVEQLFGEYSFTVNNGTKFNMHFTK